MKNEITFHVRAFPVTVYDKRSDITEEIIVPITKQQLQAAQIVGQSSKELIIRMCERQGYKVLEIGKPDKLPITIDLTDLVRQYAEAVMNIVKARESAE